MKDFEYKIDFIEFNDINLKAYMDIQHKKVDIWYFNSLKRNKCILHNFLYTALTDEEIKDVNRYNFFYDGETHLFSRGILKLILSKYIKVSSKNIDLIKTRYGKLELNKEQNVNNINFNVSHSKDLIVIAVIKDVKIGVDVEYVDEELNFKDLISNIRSSQEVNKYCRLIINREFLKLWTKKEAFVKGTGVGLSRNLKSFYVITDTNKVIFDKLSGEEWYVDNLSLLNDYELSLVIERKRSKE